ncbi:MAG: bifunctional 4-hydroxy-2-oxoglutarate aldolase/2-dehydro-3-deoxy-phosphogluconate aldolase [Bacteroidota bacterium]
MARFSRIEVALKMFHTGIVPVYYHPDLELVKQVIKACYKGGIRVFEFTNRGDGADRLCRQLLEHCRVEFPDLALGIGSIVEAPTASLYIQMGMDFIVSPLLHPEMAKVCNRRKVLWAPGCGTMTEIGLAEELGAEVVKIFPAAQVGGPSFVKGIKGPSPWTNLMPTGGVSPQKEELDSWFQAGVWCVGMGSKLISPELIKRAKFDDLTHKVKSAIQVVSAYR